MRLSSFFTFILVAIHLVSYSQLKPEDTEQWLPEPKIITFLGSNLVPSDAIILFDGKSLSNFENDKGGIPLWDLKDGIITIAKDKGDMKTKQKFGSFQLHIEWRTPSIIDGDGQYRGNSGVFIQERYEVQVLDCFNNKTYVNGQAGAIYKQTPPLVNASKKPGEWQIYDIVFNAPKFFLDSTLAAPAFITVIHNGVLIQNHTEIKGLTLWQGKPYYKAHGKAPLVLQGHGNLVSYRNIWVRELE